MMSDLEAQMDSDVGNHFSRKVRLHYGKNGGMQRDGQHF